MAERKRRTTQPPFRSSARETKTDLLAKVKTRAVQGIALRKQWMQRYYVERLHEVFLGRSIFAQDMDNDFIVNRFWPTIKALIPSLIFNTPKFNVAPIHRNADQQVVLHAAMGEGILEAIATQEGQLRRGARLAVLQSFFSMGVMKVLYEPKMIRNPAAGEPMFLTNAGGAPVMDMVSGLPRPLVDPETGQAMKEPARVADDETYKFKWINALNMILPDEGPDMGDWSWIGEEIEIPLEDAQEDERFPKKLRDQLQANASSNQDTASRRSISQHVWGETQGHRETEMFTYIEQWDIKKRKLYITADGQSFSETDFLVNDDLPDGIEHHPYAILPGYTPVLTPPSPWPLPHVYNWLGHQEEWNLRRHQLMEGAKRTARKGYYDDSTFADADEAVKALQSPTDMEFVRINNREAPPVIIPDTPLPNNIVQDLQMLDQDWIRVTGQPAFGGRRQSATRDLLEDREGNIRDTDMRADVEEFLATAGQKMLQLVQGTLTLGMYIKLRSFNDTEFQQYLASVYGPDAVAQLAQLPGLKQSFMAQFGNARWVQISREQLEFESRITVVPGSGRPRTMEAEKAQLMEFLQIIGQFPQLGLSPALLRTVAAHFEFINDSVVDEVHALARQMVDVQANQAGRNQGNDGGGQGAAAPQNGQAGPSPQALASLLGG